MLPPSSFSDFHFQTVHQRLVLVPSAERNALRPLDVLQADAAHLALDLRNDDGRSETTRRVIYVDERLPG